MKNNILKFNKKIKKLFVFQGVSLFISIITITQNHKKIKTVICPQYMIYKYREV